MTVKSFTTTTVSSTHGTRKAAVAKAEAGNRFSGSAHTFTVEHTGPRLFAVICTTVVESSPAPVRHIMGGTPIVCTCGSADWYYTGRSLFSLDYQCAGCERHISPPSETGACS